MRCKTLIVSTLFGQSLSKLLRRDQAQGITFDAAFFAQRSFDYVIVGGGTAGLVLAARLSEDPEVNVGVIEAGLPRFDEDLVNTPARLAQAFSNPKFDWGFESVPQSNVNGRSIELPRGKMLGGSSGLNFMIWQRASQGDYDNWSELGVGGGWNWDGLLPYFEKHENVTLGPSNTPYDFTERGGTGVGEGHSGPLPISFNNFYSSVAGPYVQSLVSMGVPKNADPDNGDTTGFFNCPGSVDPTTGNRSYSARDYLLPNAGRSNLAVLVGAYASKIEFAAASATGANATATGVQFIVDGTNFNVSASKEVILSAGTIQTPQMLELSGIGNPALLSTLGIPVVFANSAVGENLQDHLVTHSAFLLADPSIPTLDMLFSNTSFASSQQPEYLSNHTGIFTYTPSAISFHPLKQFWTPGEIDTALTQLQTEIEQANVTAFTKKQYQLQIDGIKQGKLPQMELVFVPGTLGPTETTATEKLNFVDISNFGSMPFGRGSVHINTTDPLAPPLIDPAYLQFSIDKQVMVKGAQISRQISQITPFSDFLSGSVQPSSNVSTDADFENFVLETLGTEWHPVGTASLGPLGEGGVVADDLIVYGTSNVRVVDASIMPMQIATHIQSTVYAIAEKAADIIKAAH